MDFVYHAVKVLALAVSLVTCCYSSSDIPSCDKPYYKPTKLVYIDYYITANGYITLKEGRSGIYDNANVHCDQFTDYTICNELKSIPNFDKMCYQEKPISICGKKEEEYTKKYSYSEMVKGLEKVEEN